MVATRKAKRMELPPSSNESQTSRASPKNAASSSYSPHQTQAKKQYVEKSVKDFRERRRSSNSDPDPPQPMSARGCTGSLVAQAHNDPLPQRKVAYPEVIQPPDPPPVMGDHGCPLWLIIASLLLVAVAAVLRIPNLNLMHNVNRGFLELEADRNQVDYRVLALDFLRTWTLENELPTRWSNELEDALLHVEESESRDPQVGTGVLLSCKVEENCKNVMDKLEKHLLEQAISGKQCVVRLDHSVMDGDDLDGQVQQKIVQALKPCQKAVVIVDAAHRMPYKAAKVFTNALSEMGGFIDWGKHVPSTNALYLMSTVAESDANMSLENFIKMVKDHLVTSLSKVDRLLNEGEAKTNMPAINAGALRRRLSWVIPVDPSKY